MTSKVLPYIITLILIMSVGWVEMKGLGTTPAIITGTGSGMSLLASCSGSKCIACNELQQLNNASQQCSNASASVNSVVYSSINVLSIIVGIIAVLMIIISGFRFIVSGGDSNNCPGCRHMVGNQG